MAAHSPLDVVRFRDSDANMVENDKWQKTIDDKIFVLKKAANNNNPGFKLTLNDRFFFLKNGYNATLNSDRGKTQPKPVKLVPYNPNGNSHLQETRPDLKYNQHSPINTVSFLPALSISIQARNNYNSKTYTRPDWQHFGGHGDHN